MAGMKKPNDHAEQTKTTNQQTYHNIIALSERTQRIKIAHGKGDLINV